MYGWRARRLTICKPLSTGMKYFFGFYEMASLIQTHTSKHTQVYRCCICIANVLQIRWFCINTYEFNSLALGRFEWNVKQILFNLISVIDVWSTFWRIALRWLSLDDLINDELTLAQIMAWCCDALSHYRGNINPALYHHMASLNHNEWCMMSLDFVLHVLDHRLVEWLIRISMMIHFL